MDQITHDVRTAQWAEIVRSCHERPDNQTAKDWLTENGIDLKQYYYWQRKLRNRVAGTTNKSLPATRPTGEATFVEMPTTSELPVESPQKTVTSCKRQIIRLPSEGEISYRSKIALFLCYRI